MPHIYLWPIKTKFIQTPEAVYILHELGPFYRVVWLNSKHPEDPDPQWWGHSIGWYENGDTLVVDTIGFTDKTWLDQMGHPHTEQLHLTERYKRVDATTLELDMVIDDPGAYTKPWNAHRNFTLSKTGFLRYQQICSVRENQRFEENLAKPAPSRAEVGRARRVLTLLDQPVSKRARPALLPPVHHEPLVGEHLDVVGGAKPASAIQAAVCSLLTTSCG